MSRIYVVVSKRTGSVVRYVRAANLNQAVRAVAAESYEAKPMSSDEMYQASRSGVMDVLDIEALGEVEEESAPVRAVK